MFGRTYAVIMAKKIRMCARFGHVKPPFMFRTFGGDTAGYCPRCGECVRTSNRSHTAAGVAGEGE